MTGRRAAFLIFSARFLTMCMRHTWELFYLYHLRGGEISNNTNVSRPCTCNYGLYSLVSRFLLPSLSLSLSVFLLVFYVFPLPFSLSLSLFSLSLSLSLSLSPCLFMSPPPPLSLLPFSLCLSHRFPPSARLSVLPLSIYLFLQSPRLSLPTLL